jgi:hypothetical protein
MITTDSNSNSRFRDNVYIAWDAAAGSIGGGIRVASSSTIVQRSPLPELMIRRAWAIGWSISGGWPEWRALCRLERLFSQRHRF